MLLVALVALYLGLLSPRHVVQKQDAQIEELKKLLGDREKENAALHNERLKDIEEKAELRGEVSALRTEVAMHRQEVKALREEVVRLRQSREE